MASETPEPGCEYDTLSYREARRVIRKCRDAIHRSLDYAAAARRRQEKAEREALRDLEAATDELDALTELFFRSAMLAAGYHQHDRGSSHR